MLQVVSREVAGAVREGPHAGRLRRPRGGRRPAVL